MKLKVAQLKEKLEEKGLDTKGTKPTLVARLLESLDSDNCEQTPKIEAQKVSNTPSSTRRSKRVSETIAEERPSTPVVKRSRRLSNSLGVSNEGTLTPRRKSRRLSGEGPIENKETEENTLLENEKESNKTESPELDPILEKPIEEEMTPESKEEVNEEDTSKESTNDKIMSDIETTNEEFSKADTKSDVQTTDETKEDLKAEVEVSCDKNSKSGPKACDEKEAVNELAEKINEKQSDNVNISETLKKIFVARQIPRQKPKSGKFWKGERHQFRQIKRDRGQKISFEQRMKLKEDKMKNKELADYLLSKKAEKKEEERKRAEENKANRLENQKKSEQYQIIKNPAKIKRMKKKQLKMLEKRDLIAAS